MFSALQDPASAAAFMDAKPDCKLKGGNTHAFMYQWLNTLKNLGLNDAAVTADYPLADVLNKNGKKTYVVYNGDAKHAHRFA